MSDPYRDGTTHVIFEPLDFIAGLAALVPRPRVHLTRYHGVFAPHRALRAEATPAGRGAGKSPGEIKSPAERHQAMSWAQRLQRVFRIDLERCARCGGKLRIIASIKDPVVIGRILDHLKQRQPRQSRGGLPHPARGPPQGVLALDCNRS